MAVYDGTKTTKTNGIISNTGTGLPSTDKEYGDARRNTSEAPRKTPRAAGEGGLPSAELVFPQSGAVFRRSTPARCRVR